MKFHCSSHRKFEQIVVTSTEQPPDQLCDGKTCGSGSHIIAFDLISSGLEVESIHGVPSRTIITHSGHCSTPDTKQMDGKKTNRQAANMGNTGSPNSPHQKKRESRLQDVNLEKFWTFVRVAYVCIHVCVHVCIKSVCEGMDPHSFLGNGQFKILAFPYIPLVLWQDGIRVGAMLNGQPCRGPTIPTSNDHWIQFSRIWNCVQILKTN